MVEIATDYASNVTQWPRVICSENVRLQCSPFAVLLELGRGSKFILSQGGVLCLL